MDNFDLTKYLAEGKLHEAMSPQDVVDIADTVAEEFTKESAEAGEFLVYSVGRMEADDMSFELDTDISFNTPKNIDTRGVGEGWGGIFRIKPTEDGYEVRNAEKGGLVAMIDTMGNFRMLSADESRAEMGLEEEYGVEGPEAADIDAIADEPISEYTNKMEKSKLEEGIIDTIKDKIASVGKKLLDKFSPEEQASMKAAAEKVLGPNYSKEDITLDKAKEIGKIISGGLDESQELDENLRKKIGGALAGLGMTTAFAAGHGFGGTDAGAITAGIGIVAAMIGMLMAIVDEAQEAPKSSKMKKSELKEMIRAAFLNEAEGDEEEDVEVDTEEEIEDVDVDVDADVEDTGEMDVEDDAKVELTGDKAAVSDNLEAALEAARALGDEKLVDQIGNTITFFTRAHIVKEAEMELEEIQNSPELEKAKEDYKAGKISLADYQAIVKKLDFKGVKDAEAAGQAKKDAIADKNKDLADKKAAVKQAEEDRKAGKISQEEFAKIVQANQYVNKENLNESIEFPLWNRIK